MAGDITVNAAREPGSRRGALIAGVAGMLWPVLAMVRLPLTRGVDQPPWTAPPDAITDYYANAAFDAAFVIGVGVATLAYVLLLVFVAKVAELAGRLDGGSRWVGYVIVGGAVVDVGLVLGYLATFATAVFWASHGGLGTDGYLVLGGLSWGLLWLDMIPLALWLAALGLAIIGTGLFPRWLGWAILINAVALVVSFALPVEASYVTGGLPYLWILVAAGLMVIRPGRYAATTTGAVP